MRIYLVACSAAVAVAATVACSTPREPATSGTDKVAATEAAPTPRVPDGHPDLRDRKSVV